MAEELFNFPFVKKIFMAANFITITKTDNVPWDFITMELREFVKGWIADGKDVLIQMPAPKPAEETTTESAPKKCMLHQNTMMPFVVYWMNMFVLQLKMMVGQLNSVDLKMELFPF